MSRPQMWVPKTQTKVTVDQQGNVNVWDEMTMELRAIRRTGFKEDARPSHEPHDHNPMGQAAPGDPPT